MSGGRSVQVYAYGVGLLGAAVSIAAALTLPVSMIGWRAAVLAVIGLGAALAPLRFVSRGGTRAATLDEAVVLAMLFALPLGVVPALIGVVTGLAHLIARNGSIKLAYNAGALATASGAAAYTFDLFDPGSPLASWGSVTAAVVCVLVFFIVTQILVAELFRRLESRPYRDTMREIFGLNASVAGGNLLFGLVLAFAVIEGLALTVVVSLTMVGVFVGYRGYAGSLEERQRNERLHDVAQALASATGSPDALGRFLRQLAKLLGGERAEIVLIVRDSARYLTVDASGELNDRAGDHLPRLLDEALHGGRAILHSEVDEDANHRDALAAPLVFEDKTIGALAVYDRHGLGPWDASDVKLLSSLAHEAAVAVKNVELVADLSEQTRKLGNIVNAASDGIALVDEHGRVVTWNPAFERMTGLRSPQVIGRPWQEALRVEDERSNDQLDLVMRTVLTGRSVDLPVDLHVARASDDHRWLRCTFAPVDADDAGRDDTGAVLVARDVTREREAEELKTDFIATVSHELRTPLTPLKGFLSTAESRWDELDREQLREMVSAMRRQVDRLEALIADLLTVSDLDRETVPLQHSAIDLTRTVEDAVSLLPVAAGERVEIAGDPTVRALGDAGAIGRVIRALTDNALKHTTGMVTVTVGYRGDDATVAVSDEGPGIREWDRDRIFERFGRLGDHLTRNQGPGLGLAIARSLAERLGGQLELESEVGRGSTFLLSLPRATMIEVTAG